MPRRCLLSVLICVLPLTLLLPTPAHAGHLLEWLIGHHQRLPPDYVGNPKRIVAAPPGPHRYGEYNVYSPWYGYGFGVPTYQWGYFGARYRPACISHKGYYGDLSQWGYRRGY